MKPRFALLSLLTVCGSLHAAELRIWTDKSTNRQIEASMQSADPQARTVTIVNKAGQSFTLPVDRLVDADLAYIKANLTAPAAPTPTPGATPATPAPSAPAGQAKAATPATPVGNPAPPPPVITQTPIKKFKAPAGNAILGAVKRERPRILMNAAAFSGLKTRIAADATMQKLLTNVKATCEAWLKLPTLEQKRGESQGIEDFGPHNEGLHRFASYGILQYVEADPRFKDRMKEELSSLARFTNWKPDEPETCADFTVTAALGYDWFRSSLNDQEAVKVRTALKELGMDALMAHLKGESLPVTAKRPEPGTSSEPAKPAAKKKVEEDSKAPKTAEDVIMAGALLIAAISIMDEEPSAAAPAATLAAKILGDGVTQFAPEGIWTEGLSAGEHVQNMLALVVMTLRSSCGTDFGITSVEGLPQSLHARLALTGPSGSLFNYGNTASPDLRKNWVLSFLQMNYGNPGYPALKVGAAAAAESYGLNQAGTLLFYSPWSGGYTTPTQTDYVLPSAQVATLRSSYEKNAFFIGIKGGDNAFPGAHLDLGTFVLEALGQRWGIDLGKENGRGAVKNLKDPKRFAQYKDSTKGQNTLRFAGPVEDDDKKAKGKGAAPASSDPSNQALDAKAAIVGFTSTPERGAVIIDLAEAYSTRAKDYQRGAMIVRGTQPYALIQDEISIKNASSPDWIMHTKAEVTVEGKKAILKQGGATLTATLLSPEGASFAVAEAPEPPGETLDSLKGIRTLKVPLLEVKGDQTITILFSAGDAPAGVATVPLAQWIPKKK